jgi:hypothetical protein
MAARRGSGRAEGRLRVPKGEARPEVPSSVFHYGKADEISAKSGSRFGDYVRAIYEVATGEDSGAAGVGLDKIIDEVARKWSQERKVILPQPARMPGPGDRAGLHRAVQQGIGPIGGADPPASILTRGCGGISLHSTGATMNALRDGNGYAVEELSNAELDALAIEVDELNAAPKVREFPKMDSTAFYGLPSDIVATLKPHTESDPVALLLTLHAFFGNSVGRGPYYQVEGDRHHCNLFALMIGDTAKARKGTAAGRIRQLFRVAEGVWEKSRIQTGLSSGEGLIWEVRDPITRIKDGEEQQIDGGAADKRLMILESEFGGALNAMSREGNILSRVIRDGWDGGNLNTLVKNNPARATSACISIIGHITADELRRYMTKTEMANGFANRFLFACVRRSQLLPFGGAIDDQAVQELGAKIGHAIRRARSIERVKMHSDTRPIWREVYRNLSESRPGLLGALAARAEAQTVRLALLYSLWDDRAEIEPVHLRAALAVWRFCAESVEYLFGDALGDPVADAILQGLKAADGLGMGRTEISNLFSRNAEAGQIGRALEELGRLKLAHMRKMPPAGGEKAVPWKPGTTVGHDRARAPAE